MMLQHIVHEKESMKLHDIAPSNNNFHRYSKIQTDSKL